MKENNQIHILCQELIPLYKEVDENAKEVINEHCKSCSECKDLLQNTNIIDRSFSDHNNHIPVNENKRLPFSKLIWFKRSIFLGVILIRLFIIGMIFNDYYHIIRYTEAPVSLADEGVRASMLLFYIPYSFISLIFSLPLTRARNVGILAIFDIAMLLIFSNWGN